MTTAAAKVTVPAMPLAVAAVFAAYPAPVRRRMLRLRALIFEVAARTDGVGVLTETLRWGEPAYRTEQTGSGSPVRLGFKPRSPDTLALHFICTTTLVTSFRREFEGELNFEGTRSIVFDVREALPLRPIKACLAAALTYHLKAGRRGARDQARGLRPGR